MTNDRRFSLIPPDIINESEEKIGNLPYLVKREGFSKDYDCCHPFNRLSPPLCRLLSDISQITISSAISPKNLTPAILSTPYE